VKALLVAVALCAVATAAAAQPADPAGDAFRDATGLLGDGKLAEAQAAFEAVAALDPAGPWADDALAEAAGAAERRGDLAAARRLWRRVLDEHPASRQSRRARARVAAIEKAIGEGGRWLQVAEQHEAILRASIGKSDPSAEVEALAALVAAYPDYPRAHEARMWIGDAWMRLGRPGAAAARFQEARERATDPDERWRAGKAHGDALAMAGDLDGAERIYRGMLGEGDDLADRALAEALADVAKMRTRSRLVLAAWIVLAAGLLLALASAWWLAGGVRPALRALARPPIEVWFFLPVALVFLGVSMSGNFLVEAAVREILLGGLAITWLGGATLELARRRGRLRLPVVLVHVVATTAVIAAVCYLAVMHDRLIDMLAETWHHGHDR
jgi:outer membrane protein assembly factor BamD (BamD/ComL family)